MDHEHGRLQVGHERLGARRWCQRETAGGGQRPRTRGSAQGTRVRSGGVHRPIAPFHAEEARAPCRGTDSRADLARARPEPAVDGGSPFEPGWNPVRAEEAGRIGCGETRRRVGHLRARGQRPQRVVHHQHEVGGRMPFAKRAQRREREQEIAERSGEDDDDAFN